MHFPILKGNHLLLYKHISIQLNSKCCTVNTFCNDRYIYIYIFIFLSCNDKHKVTLLNNIVITRDDYTENCPIASIISPDKEILICTFSQLKVILATSHRFSDKSPTERKGINVFPLVIGNSCPAVPLQQRDSETMPKTSDLSREDQPPPHKAHTNPIIYMNPIITHSCYRPSHTCRAGYSNVYLKPRVSSPTNLNFKSHLMNQCLHYLWKST